MLRFRRWHSLCQLRSPRQHPPLHPNERGWQRDQPVPWGPAGADRAVLLAEPNPFVGAGALLRGAGKQPSTVWGGWAQSLLTACATLRQIISQINVFWSKNKGSKHACWSWLELNCSKRTTCISLPSHSQHLLCDLSRFLSTNQTKAILTAKGVLWLHTFLCSASEE